MSQRSALWFGFNDLLTFGPVLDHCMILHSLKQAQETV